MLFLLTFLFFIIIIIIVITSQGTCARKLARQHIHVLQAEKIKTIADVSVVCFDKTGTLTGSVVSCLLMCFVKSGTLTGSVVRLLLICRWCALTRLAP